MRNLLIIGLLVTGGVFVGMSQTAEAGCGYYDYGYNSYPSYYAPTYYTPGYNQGYYNRNVNVYRSRVRYNQPRGAYYRGYNRGYNRGGSYIGGRNWRIRF